MLLTAFLIAVAAAVALFVVDVIQYYVHRTRFRDKHVVITGGSSGIGLALAKQFVTHGSHVTLIARTARKLEGAVEELKALRVSEDQNLGFETADTCSAAQVAAALDGARARSGPVDALVCSAGRSVPGYFLEQNEEVFRSTMELNYMGTVNCVKAVAPEMTRRGSGDIVVVASAAAVIGFMGYASYCPTKWALRGFTDCVRNELRGFGIHVCIGYPPDTDTPGFEEENKSKPKETLQISPPSVYPPQPVADALFSDLVRRKYHLGSPDLVQNLLVASMSGVTPRRNAALDALLAPLLVGISVVFRAWMDYVSTQYGRRCRREAGAASGAASPTSAPASAPAAASKPKSGTRRRKVE